MSRAAWALVLTTALAAGWGCEVSEPVIEELRVTLATPNPGDDLALLLTVRGPVAPTSATAGAGLRVFHLTPFPGGRDTTRFVVTGRLEGGVILSFGVPKFWPAEFYSARVDEVAASDYRLRSTLDGYSLQVTK